MQLMSVPTIIPIKREENYHTHNIGRYEEDHQFMGFVVASLPMPPPVNWQKVKRWYALLYCFDSAGNYLNAQHECLGTTAEGEKGVIKAAQKLLDEWLQALPNRKFGDVAIKLFSLEIDCRRFGLIDVSEPEDDYERVDLVPNELAFFPPWEGDYDT